jgi:hypothetical protein
MPLPRPASSAAIVLVLLSGCGDLTSGGSGASPSSGQITELMLAAQDELEAQLPQFSVVVPGVPLGGTLPVGCPPAPSNTTDSDGDGILDDATITYTNPPCLLTGLRGGTAAVTGQVRIVDPSVNATSFNLTFTDLTWDYTAPSGGLDYSVIRNGTLARSGTSSAVTVASLRTTKRQRGDIIALATLSLDLDWTFTASTPGSIQADQPLPDGSLTVAGSLGWVRSSEHWNLTVATPTPLVYDASCTEPQRFTSGVMTLTGTVAGQAGTLALVWSNCGTNPARVWTPAGS